MIDPGRLNSRIVIQKQTAVVDSIGQPLPTWVKVCTLWANIVVKSGIETIKASSEVSVRRASVRIWYRLDIDAGMRIIHGKSIYNIIAVLPDEEGHVYMDLVVEEAT